MHTSLLRFWKALPTLRKRSEASKPEMVNALAAVPSEWTCLATSRLELGATGFAICFQVDPRAAPYLLMDPEGRPLGLGTELQSLKRYGEQMARDRLEFIPSDPAVRLLIDRIHRGERSRP